MIVVEYTDDGNLAGSIELPEPPRWHVCSHRWAQFFGTVLKCRNCGATTLLNLGDNKEQPIFGPYVPPSETP